MNGEHETIYVAITGKSKQLCCWKGKQERIAQNQDKWTISQKTYIFLHKHANQSIKRLNILGFLWSSLTPSVISLSNYIILFLKEFLHSSHNIPIQQTSTLIKNEK